LATELPKLLANHISEVVKRFAIWHFMDANRS